MVIAMVNPILGQIYKSALRYFIEYRIIAAGAQQPTTPNITCAVSLLVAMTLRTRAPLD